jgi:hypothetical protein
MALFNMFFEPVIQINKCTLQTIQLERYMR